MRLFKNKFGFGSRIKLRQISAKLIKTKILVHHLRTTDKSVLKLTPKIRPRVALRVRVVPVF
jgi:hypothetical protein